MEYKDLPQRIPLGKCKDITGIHYGSLTPMFRVGDIKWGNQKKVAWACKCDCGNYCVATAQELNNGNRTTCCEHNKGLDITGQQFGNLTAIYPTEFRTIDDDVVWYCKCNCGGYVYANTYSLRCGDRTQCNYHFENNIIGKKFGKLTVLENMGILSNGRNGFLCKCDCNPDKRIVVTGTSLLNGTTQSCGCLRIKDISEQKFGNLTAICLSSNKFADDGKALWICQCDCGNTVEVKENALMSCGTQSCGLCVSSLGEQRIKKILNDNGKSYISQMKFETCRNPKTNHLLLFDFYVISEECFLLEFDGPQHERPTNSTFFNEEQFEQIKFRDVIKNQWAYDNDVVLKRIPYKYRDIVTIDDIMSDRFIITPQTHPTKYFLKRGDF